MMRNIFLLGSALALAGCINLGEQRNTPAVANYVMSDVASMGVGALRVKAPHGGIESAPTLLVLDTTAASFYDTDKFVFSRSADTRGHYQFARWTERPGKRFADLLRARLDRQSAWRVSAAGGYVSGDVLLDTELVEFYHDAVSPPGQMRLVLRAELIDLKKRALLGRQMFEQTVPLMSYDAAGAAMASNLAVSRALDDLGVWLATFR